MLSAIGAVVVLAMVFGGYLAAGGKLGVILEALPFELMMIGGAAVGAFLIGNDTATLKRVLGDLGRVLKGPRWHEKDYVDLLCLLYALLRLARRDAVALEEHIERPGDSAIFAAHPRIRDDAEATAMIADAFRLTAMSFEDPHQLEDLLERQLAVQRKAALSGSGALQTMADGLPALGIVAAVLGIIKTMSSIDKPPEILGAMIGAALVGTFLGVFLSYGFVGPAAHAARHAAEEDLRFYAVIRDVLVANQQRHSPQICVEVARQALPAGERPGFDALETALKSTGEAAA